MSDPGRWLRRAGDAEALVHGVDPAVRPDEQWSAVRAAGRESRTDVHDRTPAQPAVGGLLHNDVEVPSAKRAAPALAAEQPDLLGARAVVPGQVQRAGRPDGDEVTVAPVPDRTGH